MANSVLLPIDLARQWYSYTHLYQSLGNYLMNLKKRIQSAKNPRNVDFVPYPSQAHAQSCSSSILFFIPPTRHPPPHLPDKTLAATKYLHMWSTEQYLASSELLTPHSLSTQRVCPPRRTKDGGYTLAGR
jgi:hypothetical protein